MSYVGMQAEVVALLRTIPNVKTYQGRTDDEIIIQIDASADKMQPFNTISFGGFVDPGRRMNGIVGAAHDTHMATIVVRSVANSDKDSQRLWQRCWDLLIGYVPKNCGEIHLLCMAVLVKSVLWVTQQGLLLCRRTRFT